MQSITRFQTDYQDNPIGIDNTSPQFSWVFSQVDGLFQQTYRILVSTECDSDGEKRGNMWDSGTVKSSLSAGIEYAGKPLASRTKYYVKLITAVNSGQTLTAQGTFETALLDKSEWLGKWVTIPVNFQGGALQLRKTLENFPMEKKLVSARAYVAGIGYHEFYTNGKLVTKDRLVPAVSEYSKTVFYMTYDLTELLTEEHNVIGVVLGHGWLGDRKLLIQLYARFEDGTEWEDHTANCCGWWVTGSPITGNSIYGGETYDARIAQRFEGWTSNSYESGWENGWMYTVLTQPPAGELRAQTIDPIRVTASLPVVADKVIDGVRVLDIGRNIAGWAKIKVKGPAGSLVRIRFGEDIKEDGRVNFLNLRTAGNTDTYILCGSGEEEWEPRFTYHGFRYAEIETEGGAELLFFEGKHVHSDVRPCGSFRCSDDILNKLHDNAVLTEANNLHGIMTDCPQRDERFGWLNDLSSRVYQTVCNFGMERFFPKVIEDISETQNELGEISDTAPFYTGSRPADPVSVCYLLMGLYCYRHYGNKQVLREHYEGFKAWTESLLAKQDGFIMNYYYYADWVAPSFDDTHTDGIYVSTVYLNWHLQCMAEIAGILGLGDEAHNYAELAEKSKKAINEKYYVHGKGFSTGSQAANSMALSLGLAPKAAHGELAAAVADDIIRRGYHSSCGNQGYRHMFYALSDAGYDDLLIKMIKNPQYPGWGFAIANGATTVWERWEREMNSIMHSLNHPMFGSYDGWFYNCLGGINIAADAQAADKLVFAPRVPDSLEFAECSIETLRGRAECSWRKEGNRVHFSITVPSNTSAAATLPGKIVSINGKPAAGQDIDLVPGRYEIVTEQEGKAACAGLQQGTHKF